MREGGSRRGGKEGRRGEKALISDHVREREGVRESGGGSRRWRWEGFES